jgi:hypothetical protein
MIVLNVEQTADCTDIPRISTSSGCAAILEHYLSIAAVRVRTMECFNLFQEPLEPTSIESHIPHFLERATDVDSGVVSKLCPLYQVKNDGVFEADQNLTDALKRERVFLEHEILGQHGGEWDEMVGGIKTKNVVRFIPVIESERLWCSRAKNTALGVVIYTDTNLVGTLFGL